MFYQTFIICIESFDNELSRFTEKDHTEQSRFLSSEAHP